MQQYAAFLKKVILFGLHDHSLTPIILCIIIHSCELPNYYTIHIPVHAYICIYVQTYM